MINTNTYQFLRPVAAAALFFFFFGGGGGVKIRKITFFMLKSLRGIYYSEVNLLILE